MYGIPSSSIRDHLYGRTTSRQKGIRPVLTPHDEKEIVDYVFNMQDRGHPLTAAELRLKVATATQTRPMPWSARGVPSKGWLRRFRSRHPEISSRRSQGLEVARARALCPITSESLYANLERLYTAHSYPPIHIWNCDESGVQAGRVGGATVLARRGSRSIHSIELDQKEHLSVLSCVNANGGCIPNFYILKGCYFLQDYIANYEKGVVMGMQPNAWMTRWLFESWISHFIECLKRGPGVDLTNRHLLILDRHNSHVTLEVVKIFMELGLDIVSLPSHTSHALQPLDIACFKPFKTAFRQIRDVWCLRNKDLPVGKQTLCEWTSTALKHALTASNIRAGFRRASIWPLDRKAAKTSMASSTGFKEGSAVVQSSAVTGGTSQSSGGMTCPTSHPEAAKDLATGRAGNEQSDVNATCMHAAQRQLSDGESSSEAADLNPACRRLHDDEEAFVGAVDAPPLGEVQTSMHYYVDVRNSDDSTHLPGHENVEIDLGCHEHLQESCESQDISTFLALPEIIPARQRRRPQLLLDFTKSKILTSRTYTESCERLLAQKEAIVSEAKRKADLRKATKETRRREKAEHELKVRACKEARSAKRDERLQEEAEKRLRSTGRYKRSSGAPPTPGSPPRSPQVHGDQFLPRCPIANHFSV